MRIALVSLDQIWQDKRENFERCASIMEEAKTYGCELVIFPEMTLTGYSLAMSEVSEVENQSLTLNWFKDAASRIGLTAVFGTCLHDLASKKPKNTLCLACPDKEAEVIYSKIHPFSFAGEDKVIDAGNRLGIFQMQELNIGATVCYDLRFPELYAAMANQCNAMIVIANWPKKRLKHWYSLIVARAIENQCFMFGVNRIGIDGNGLEYQKSSIAVSPVGDLLVPTVLGKELDIYDFEPIDVAIYRSGFPTIRDKRSDLYSDLFRKINE